MGKGIKKANRRERRSCKKEQATDRAVGRKEKKGIELHCKKLPGEPQKRNKSSFAGDPGVGKRS